ncbi:MAG TPA: peptidase MA family metallohydrolase [Candidatus Limnocylindria bacterium]|nr:peptidase MA family metallohydrolase [Candidatus Limnocylindria bacterium]
MGAVMARAARRAMVLALLASALLIPTAFAADPTFQAAKATATFLDSISVEQRVTLPSGVNRIEAVVRSGTEGRTFLAEIANPGAGEQTLRYRHETPSGSLYPNTVVELGFRITLDDGTTIDGPTDRVRYEDTRFTWKTLEGELVRIHWVEGDDAFGRRALRIGDEAVKNATELLGVQETEPVDFFVYGDRDAFYDVLGPALQENVGGIALADIRTMFANIAPSQGNDPWVSIVVPHELTHLVFDTATRNVYHAPPHWLNEGLADYLAQGFNGGMRANVEAAARTGNLMPLHAMAGRFPSTAERFSLAYDESVSAIDYLIRTHGQDALVKLIRSYAGGVSDDEAFTAALGVDAAGFESGWLTDLGVEPPVPFGPKPAPLGPLPPGWGEAPAPTGPPVASPPPAGPTDIDGGGDVFAWVGLAILVVIVVVVVIGIAVVARGLSRGEPLPTGGPVQPGKATAPASAGWRPAPAPRLEEPRPPPSDAPQTGPAVPDDAESPR